MSRTSYFKTVLNTNNDRIDSEETLIRFGEISKESKQGIPKVTTNDDWILSRRPVYVPSKEGRPMSTLVI